MNGTNSYVFQELLSLFLGSNPQVRGSNLFPKNLWITIFWRVFLATRNLGPNRSKFFPILCLGWAWETRIALQNRSLLLENQRFAIIWKVYFNKISRPGKKLTVFTSLTILQSGLCHHGNHTVAPKKKSGAACVSSAAEQIAVFPPAERCDEVWRWHTSR